MATLYDILDVHEEATDDELKRAYRRAAMKAHPDRNVGHEASANARFQEIKEAYAILSDAVQRRVYDAVYAEEMGRLARQREAEERRLQAVRDAEYARFVALAMRFAEQGHNRDVVLGVLLGHDCEVQLAGRIADSVVALHASRQAAASRDAQGSEQATQRGEDATPAASPQNHHESDTTPQSASEHTPKDDARTGEDRTHPNIFSALWHGMFGLHP
jgi:DnaJ-class molecular chaperone